MTPTPPTPTGPTTLGADPTARENIADITMTIDGLASRVDKLETATAPTVQPVAGSPVPQGWVFFMPQVADQAERDAVRAQIEYAAGHDKFALIWPDVKGNQAQVMAPAELHKTLAASLSDIARERVVEEGRKAAATAASEAIAAHGLDGGRATKRAKTAAK